MTSPLFARATRTRAGARAAIALLAMAAGIAAQAPLTLADVIREVRRNSDETRLIAEKSAKLQAVKGELWAAALPNVSAYANAGRGASPFNLGTLPLPGDSTGDAPSVYSATQNVYSYGVQVQQTLLSPSLGQSIVTAGKQIRAQDAANRRSLQELELQALDAYYAVILAETRLRVIGTSLQRQARTAGFLEANFRRGAGSRSTLLLTQASLKGLEPERIRAERDVEAARMALNRLMGRPIDAPLALDTAAAALNAGTPEAPSAAAEASLENRPDLQALRLQKETLEGYARVYRLQYLPSIGVQGKWGILAYELDDQLTDFDNNLEWQVGVGLTWSLFDGFGNRAKARQYDSDVRTLAANERQARAFARIELESARRDVAAADTALAAARQARDASAEAADMIDRDFRAGAGQVTDLLAAEEGLRNAELALEAARYQKTRALASLRLAQGMDLIKETSK